MAFKDFFNYRRRKDADTAPAPTPEEKKITAGGQITRPGATITVIQPQRFGLDLSAYKQAVRSAENMDWTRRTRLYDMYEDAMLDTHVMSVVSKRRNAILASPVEFWRDGVPDDAVNVQIKSPWFRQLVGDIFDAQLWGFSLMQITMERDGYAECFSVPRKHVDPQLRLIRRHQTDTGGIPFDEYPGLLLVNGETRLGLLAACVPWVIRKNGTVGDWCQFSELFGMPIRDYAYDASDETARQRALADATSQGSASVFIHQDTTKLNFVEAGNKTGSADCYDRLTETCNAEISKAILGNTLTTEASDTGTQALGTVHKTEEEGLMMADRTFVLNVLNYRMTDIFRSLGINTDGGEFVFADTSKTGPKEKAELLSIARNQLGLPISDDYIYQELGIEKPADYDRMKAEEEERRRNAEAAAAAAASPGEDGEEPDGGGAQRTLQNRRGGGEAPGSCSRFFGGAPDARALKW